MVANKEYTVATPETVRYDPLPQGGELRQASMYAGNFRDIGFAIGFVVHLFGLAGLAVVFNSSVESTDTQKVDVDEKIMDGVGAAIGTTILFSVMWLVMMRMCATTLLWISILFSLAMMVAACILNVIIGNTLGLFVCMVLVLLQICWIYCVRNRIAMAAAMLEIAVDVGQMFWGIFVSSVLMIFVAACVISMWGYSAYCVFKHIDNEDAQYAAALCFLFSLLWIINVKRYIVHSTAAGATGSWFFSVSEADPSSVSRAGSSASALGRSLSTSLGSICYGALVISIIELMKILARSLRGRDNNAVVQFIGCCLECLLQCIEDIVEYINSYAFTICAIYGDDYCTAVSKTMNLFSTNGFDLIINDDLIESVLFMGSLACGLVGAGSGYFMARNGGDDDKLVCGIAGFFIGLGMMSIVNATVVSCVKSVFVCFALDPLVLYNTKHSKYQKLTDAWRARWPEELPCQAYLNVAVPTEQGNYQQPQANSWNQPPQPQPTGYAQVQPGMMPQSNQWGEAPPPPPAYGNAKV